jgi:hypothetical protein
MAFSLARQRRGDFNHQAVISAVEVVYTDMLPTFRYHNLVQNGTCTRADEARSLVASFGWIGCFDDGRS